MRDVCCKLLAAVFIILIMVSLIQMRREIQQMGVISNRHSATFTDHIKTFDMVILPDTCLGIVEEINKGMYHVTFRDKFGNIIHGTYSKKDLKKVIVVYPEPD